jgi:secretion/DNA translocation related TadE-like protein
MRAGPARSERGSVTVIAAVAATALLSVLGVVVQLGLVTIARHGAGAAADAAAIAAAGAAGSGHDAACDRAARMAAANGGRLDQCEVIGLDVRVVVSLGAGLSGRVSSRARAGPVR